ncbi:DUF6289 family protein [Pseudomonas sp. CGJS7]|uniref:DUF6289 family protein n=1 Tax=Pseudomonas sp. CGJS7 TaxID=3109348 RepID=UPI00300A2702
MRYLAIAAFSAALIASAMLGGAQAGPAGQGYSIIYFDAAGNEVGGATANCGGQYLSWGDRTEVFKKRTWICD